MKKITKLSILLATLALASSCQDEAGLNPPQPMDITLAASSAETKTLLDGGSVKWEKGDEIAMVFTHATKAPAVHPFSTSTASPAASADFKGTLPAEVIAAEGGYHEQAYAVYPSSAVGADGSVATLHRPLYHLQISRMTERQQQDSSTHSLSSDSLWQQMSHL